MEMQLQLKFMVDFRELCDSYRVSISDGAFAVAQSVPLRASENPADEKLRHCRTCELLRTDTNRRNLLALLKSGGGNRNVSCLLP